MTNLDKLSDAQVLQLAGGFGPAIIGQTLFDRAQEIARRTNNGAFGPALVDSDYGLTITPWDDHSRRELLVIAREHQLNVKSNATRDAIAMALVRAKILPDAAAIAEGNGAGTGTDEGAE